MVELFNIDDFRLLGWWSTTRSTVPRVIGWCTVNLYAILPAVLSFLVQGVMRSRVFIQAFQQKVVAVCQVAKLCTFFLELMLAFHLVVFYKVKNSDDLRCKT
jgi:hypothetical protein